MYIWLSLWSLAPPSDKIQKQTKTFLVFVDLIFTFTFQGCRNFCTNVILISSLLWSANFAQEQESCTVTNSDSFLIVNIVESLGSQTSQETQPQELPLSGNFQSPKIQNNILILYFRCPRKRHWINPGVPKRCNSILLLGR